MERTLREYRDEDAQKGKADAILAVCQFLIEQKFEQRLLTPLQAAAAQIADVDKGATKPIMESVSLALAAWAIDMLKGAGLAVPTAAKKVAIATGVDNKKLIEFRKNLGKGRARQEAIDEYRKAHQELAIHLNAVAPEERVTLVLEVCQRMIVPTKKGI